MRILLTNDDGFFAPGIVALHHELQKLGEVMRIAPATEQSGVGHSITFLTPLIAHRVFDHHDLEGWKVEGSPADCVKLGVSELCPWQPDLVVSGVNGGLNAGINVLYSGTVAGAIEGAFFGIPSIAVSLEFDELANFEAAAAIAVAIIRDVVAQPAQQTRLYNINIPTAATSADSASELRVVPMGTGRYGQEYVKRTDPNGRHYYWATNDPPPEPTDHETDLSALADGHVTLTPLDYDLTSGSSLQEMAGWDLKLSRQL